jgi:hypothetical protein
MPALFAYLIVVGLLLGGGYGALNWLATPEPVKVLAKAKPKPPPAHYADNSEPTFTEARPSGGVEPEVSKPGAASKPEIGGSDQVQAASTDKAVPGDQPPSASPSPQLKPAAAPNQQQAKAEVSGSAQNQAQDHQDLSAQAEMPQAATGQEARQHAEAPPAEAQPDDSASARHQEERQSVQAVAADNGQAVAPVAPAATAKTAKRPHIRQASRRSEKRPLQVMTLRTIELPDGRHMTQLIPYRSGERYRDDGPAMAFEPDE